MQIEPVLLINWKTENYKREREKWGNRDEIAALFSDAEQEMTGQNWWQEEDYLTAPLTHVPEPCSNISGYLWVVLHTHSPAVTDRWGTSPRTCAANKQLFLLLTNSHATTQLSSTSTSETVLLVINVPLTHTFQLCCLLLAEGILVMFYITVFGILTHLYY